MFYYNSYVSVRPVGDSDGQVEVSIDSSTHRRWHAEKPAKFTNRLPYGKRFLAKQAVWAGFPDNSLENQSNSSDMECDQNN
jgi:hypothetical protein